MPVRVEITDSASPWLEWAAKEFPKFAASALKSTGWMMQKEIKKGITSRAPGGRPYPASIPAGKRKLFDKAFGKEPKARYNPMGRLRQAIGYQFDKRRQEVTVGWLSISAVRLGKRLEEGFSIPVSERMRTALAAVGIATSSKHFTVLPRPTIGPMYDVLESQIYPYMEGKIWEYVQGNRARSQPSKPKKRYIVKGDWW